MQTLELLVKYNRCSTAWRNVIFIQTLLFSFSYFEQYICIFLVPKTVVIQEHKVQNLQQLLILKLLLLDYKNTDISNWFWPENICHLVLFCYEGEQWKRQKGAPQFSLKSHVMRWRTRLVKRRKRRDNIAASYRLLRCRTN